MVILEGLWLENYSAMYSLQNLEATTDFSLKMTTNKEEEPSDKTSLTLNAAIHKIIPENKKYLWIATCMERSHSQTADAQNWQLLQEELDIEQ